MMIGRYMSPGGGTGATPAVAVKTTGTPSTPTACAVTVYTPGSSPSVSVLEICPAAFVFPLVTDKLCPLALAVACTVADTSLLLGTEVRVAVATPLVVVVV
jgi:hypothetical protein